MRRAALFVVVGHTCALSTAAFRPSCALMSTAKRTRTAAFTASSTTEPTISLTDLVSTCVDAAARGCAEIRAVQGKRSSGDSLSTSYKSGDARDALTEADLRAQSAIVDALREAWPDLAIVGEEDGDAAAAAAVTSSKVPLRHDLCFDNEDGPVVPLADVCVFVDPLDGTREFVEGRLENVQSLVGVSVRGRATAGAIGLPFPNGAYPGEKAAVLYGLVGVGTGVHGTRSEPPEGSYGTGAMPRIETGDSSNAVLAVARETALANGGSIHIVGGAGRKILAAAEQRCTLSIQHMGTSLWDSCAPGAIAAALGAKVTDLFGAPLVHLPMLPSYKNKHGVVASAPGAAKAHDQLCAKMRAEPIALQLLRDYGVAEAGSAAGSADGHAADVARGLDGGPLELATLDALLGSGDGALVAYRAPEGSAFRGLMSDGVRLELTWKDSEGASSSNKLCLQKGATQEPLRSP